MAQTKVKTKGITDTNVTNAKLGTDISAAKLTAGTVATARLGSGTASSSTYLAGDQTYKALSEYDDNQLQSNVAMLGFKVAVNGSLTRYNLVDQSIDEFYDTSGVDASASTNERRVASGDNYYYEGSTTGTPNTSSVGSAASAGTVDGDYTYYKWTGVTSSGTYTTDTAQDYEYLVLAGGGGGGTDTGSWSGGGGGAGGYRTATGFAVAATTISGITVGAGGAASTDGDDSVFSTITSAGGGGGGNGAIGGGAAAAGRDGGSGGGGGQIGLTGGTATPAGQGYAGGKSLVQNAANHYSAGGGGGSGQLGFDADAATSWAKGGYGLTSSIDSASTQRGGGGGGGHSNGASADSDTSSGGAGGGGNGGDRYTSTAATAGTANTGGGGGGGHYQSSGGAIASGVGGSGTVIIRRLTSATTGGGDLTLQSTDVTATAEPDYGEFVTLIENAYGTATLNTDIKGYVSRDSGSTFTQGTLVDEGTWGTNKKIVAFHDLDISGQPSGTSMCYKITTHNQSTSSKETRIYASSIGWR